MTIFDQSLDRVVGPKTAKALAASTLQLRTVEDLVRHYPRRYLKRGELTELDSLTIGEEVTVMARVSSVQIRRMRSRPGVRLEVVVTDGTGELLLTFFGKHERTVEWRRKDLVAGRIGLFAGTVGAFRDTRQLTHPEYLMLPESVDADGVAAAYADEIIPVYKATSKIKSWQVAQCVETALNVIDRIPDPVPMAVAQRLGLMDGDAAVRKVHRPATFNEAERARHRLRFEEAFVLQVELARRRSDAEAVPAIARTGKTGGILDAFDQQLPFTLTKGQLSVGEEISRDLAAHHPMHRLLQGEVGSGKTVVALRALLQVVDSGGQAALLAPTEVLAQQHDRSLRTLLGPLAEAGMLGGADTGTQVALLTGSMGAQARREAMLSAASGAAGIVVGTHALLEENVQFADLGMVVIDEQHRFGVEQRAALADKGNGAARPHVLVMTATPIPRTVAMTVFGDLWVSTLSEVPAGRADVATHVVPVTEKPQFMSRVWERVTEEVAAGHPVYVVCPRIGDERSDADSELVAVLELAEQLRSGPLAEVPIGILHGRMNPDDKEEAMRAFASGEVPVLVTTTVVEVGVDVPTASAMVVMDADRYGVSQLHQLRGRIGRGDVPGVCLLVTTAENGSKARVRLDAVAGTRDGFTLSQVDLEQRREGDILGVSQHGRSSLRLLSVIRDENLIMIARDEANTVVNRDPSLEHHPDLAEAVAALSADDQADFLDKA